MTKSIIQLANEAHLYDDDQEPLVQHLERFAALHRASIIEELTGEMPPAKPWNGKHAYTADQMREYAAGLVAKKDAENQRLTGMLSDLDQQIKTEQRLSFRAERDSLKAENLGYAKSLLDLEAEVERLTAASVAWCEVEKKL